MTHSTHHKPHFTPLLWGAATSSYQIEGAVDADGRGESIWDRFTATPGAVKDNSTGAVACDHYHRFQEDVDLMRWLGLGAYRFSIAWPRILPQGTGQVNEKGLDFYDRLVDALLEAGITPFATLYHWDLPQALQDRRGWANRDTVHAFVEYTHAVTARLGDRVQHWITHNEPWVAAFLGHYFGLHAPGWRDLHATLQVVHHMLLSHGLAVPVIKEAGGQAGIAPNMVPGHAAGEHPADVAAARRHDGYVNRWFLDPLSGRGYPQDMWDYYNRHHRGDRHTVATAATPEVQAADMDTIAIPIDFLGVNYYNRRLAADNPDGKPPQVRTVEDAARPRTLDREIYPRGLYETLTRLHRDYDFPALYVTENGAAVSETVEDDRVLDSKRRQFLQDHFAEAARAVDEGAPLRGYFVWSLLDNFEWALGYTLRYGIIRVDYQTQTRTPKQSAHWYRNFIKENDSATNFTNSTN